MTKNNLLVEIGCEELPPKALKSLGSAFGNCCELGLRENRFSFEKATWFAAPRRLALLVTGLAEKQSDVELVKKGPPVKSAYDSEGNPTKAALGWAKSNNIELSDADIVETPKGQWLQIKIQEQGKSLSTCLETILQNALGQLPIPKMMRWGDSDHQFVRPVHNICCVYGDKVIDLSLFGIDSNNQILGHRFHSPGLHTLKSADDYSQTLETLKVIADFDLRRSKILEFLNTESEIDAAQVSYDDALLDEVTSLVEWPVLLKATFDEEFLKVPKEPLIYTMKDDQKYFPLLDKNTGNLLNKFYVVSNIDSSNKDAVIEGNEKVVRPRLADAQFFFKVDLSSNIDSRNEKLKSIVYQKQLGSLYDRTLRIADLSRELSKALELGDSDLAFRAGQICKSDLTSKMVFEFPEVQGIMGSHYAHHEGEVADVADAVREHYKPRFADDALPHGDTSVVVALADKLDALTGIFGIGQKPKGDKDPFALRRAVLGIVKIVLDSKLKFDFSKAVAISTKQFDEGVLTNNDVQSDLLAFFNNRVENFFVDQGFPVNMVRSVMQSSNIYLHDLKNKLLAVSDFTMQNKNVVESLVASNKRIANIVKKSDINITELTVKEDLLEEGAEQKLFDSLVNAKTANAQSYSEHLKILSNLKDPIDTFFDNVMVNSEDEAIRQNRILLLSSIRNEFLSIADFSLLQG